MKARLALAKAKDKLRNVLVRLRVFVDCNICHWSGRKFRGDSWHPFTVCPRCGSQVRHRLVAAAMFHRNSAGVFTALSGKRVLHFAPETALEKLLAKDTAVYRTADLKRENVDFRLDISEMKSVETSAFDVVVACDVLEHVPQDSRALSELMRILTPGGWAVLTVPQKDGLATTYEDPSVTTDEGRLKAFGQEDHLRIYGNDFPELLKKYGFVVTVVDHKTFPPGLVKRHVLFPPVLSKHPLATNFRRVFLAQKPQNVEFTAANARPLI